MAARRKPKYEWNAESVRALRRYLDMSQQQMSEELGIRQQTVSDWELGYHRPRGGMAFADRPSEPVRFYGVNLCFSAHYLPHEQAEERNPPPASGGSMECKHLDCQREKERNVQGDNVWIERLHDFSCSLRAKPTLIAPGQEQLGQSLQNQVTKQQCESYSHSRSRSSDVKPGPRDVINPKSCGAIDFCMNSLRT